MGPRLRGDDVERGTLRKKPSAYTRCSATETFGPFLMVWYTTQ